MTHRDEDEEIIDSALDTLAWQRREIDRLKGDVERLREVLTVFAQIAHETDGIPACMSVNVNVNRLREARAALEKRQ